MTRRERLERKLEKRLEWAGKAEKRSDAAFDKVRLIADNIPLGQPILVGHHSERRARRDQERIRSGMSKAVEEQKLAQHHASRADGIERALDRSIFSDDENAIAALEARIAEHEAERARMVLVNKLYRKGDAAALAAMGLDLGKLQERVKAIGYSWVKAPYEAYQMTNLGGRIQADKKRIFAIKARQGRASAAEAAGGVTIERGETWSRVTFAEKPPRETIEALKAAGFHWSNGSWIGPNGKLPAGIEAADIAQAPGASYFSRDATGQASTT